MLLRTSLSGLRTIIWKMLSKIQKMTKVKGARRRTELVEIGIDPAEVETARGAMVNYWMNVRDKGQQSV
jgi:hypothetical protein